MCREESTFTLWGRQLSCMLFVHVHKQTTKQQKISKQKLQNSFELIDVVKIVQDALLPSPPVRPNVENPFRHPLAWLNARRASQRSMPEPTNLSSIEHSRRFRFPLLEKRRLQVQHYRTSRMCLRSVRPVHLPPHEQCDARRIGLQECGSHQIWKTTGILFCHGKRASCDTVQRSSNAGRRCWYLAIRFLHCPSCGFCCLPSRVHPPRHCPRLLR